MKGKNEGKIRRITFRLSTEEHTRIIEEWRGTTCRKLSDFLRRKMSSKTIVSTYRNRSLDDFMEEMIQLRKELNAIGNNFNQAVHKLHMCDTDPEIRVWLKVFQKDREKLLGQTEAIKKKISSIADEWL
jgi:hypothetical protein